MLGLQAKVEMYDTFPDTWTLVASLPTAGEYHATAFAEFDAWRVKRDGPVRAASDSLRIGQGELGRVRRRVAMSPVREYSARFFGVDGENGRGAAFLAFPARSGERATGIGLPLRR